MNVPSLRLPRRGRVAAAVTSAVLVAGGLSSSGVPAAASVAADTAGPAQHRHQAAPQRPTVVLVHGAFADATGWSREVADLQSAGYPVIAPADSLRGLTADADYLRSILATIEGPVV